MERIMVEIGLKVPPELSRIRGPEARAFRRRVEGQIASARRRNPNAVIHFGIDTPEL
jgi:hypothetical protein